MLIQLCPSYLDKNSGNGNCFSVAVNLLELCDVTHEQDQSNHEVTLDIKYVKLLHKFFSLPLFSSGHKW